MREAAEALMPDSSSSSLSRFEKTVRSTAPLFGSGDMTANLPGQFAWVQYGLTPFLRPNQPPHSRQKVGSSPMAATTFLWFILTPRPRVREPREGARWTSLFLRKRPEGEKQTNFHGRYESAAKRRAGDCGNDGSVRFRWEMADP